MSTLTAPKHLSRHERQRHARSLAFSEQALTQEINTSREAQNQPAPIALSVLEVTQIERMVETDRTPVATALLTIAGIGRHAPKRRAVLDAIAEAAAYAEAQGTITPRRAAQIARHIAGA